TRSTEPPRVAPPALPARTPARIRPMQIRRILSPYLSIFSTRLLDNRWRVFCTSSGNRRVLRVERVDPLDRSTTWPYEDGEPGAFYYQRYAHPTGVAAEE